MSRPAWTAYPPVRAGHHLDEAELTGAVRDVLAPYKQLRQVILVEEIPRLPSGKVLRRNLKQAYLETSADGAT